MSRKIKNGLVVPTDREQEMHDYLFRDGHTLQECGDKYGISRERVRQLIDMCWGETNANNDARWAKSALIEYNRKKDRAKKALKKRELMIYRYFGCHEEIVTRINGEPFTWTKEGIKSLAGEYVRHKRNAEWRGICWNINFREWWGIWEDSGKYNYRGRKKGQYVMSRYGDAGPYHKDNVKICLATDNIKEYYDNTPRDAILQRIHAGQERRKLELQATA